MRWEAREAYNLCGWALKRRELLREKVSQLPNDPFESLLNINLRTHRSLHNE